MEDENLYDEFGNYIGPSLDNPVQTFLIKNSYIKNKKDDEEVLESHSSASQSSEEQEPEQAEMAQKPVKEHQIVLHEDKKYFAEMEEVYPGVETLIMEEDTQPITQPIIEAIKSKNFEFMEKTIPETSFSFEFLGGLMNKPELIRNIGIVGHLHHGKTGFMDLFVQQTHLKDWKLDKEYHYTDTRKDEKERLLTIKAIPMSLILADSRDKSYLINIYDTPGHPNFNDEVCCALRTCDGVLLVGKFRKITYL